MPSTRSFIAQRQPSPVRDFDVACSPLGKGREDVFS
jgi:hypothetical protein